MKYIVLRFAFSLAGIVLLFLIGILGEGLINIANMVVRDSGADPDSSLIPTLVLYAHVLIVALALIVAARSYQKSRKRKSSSSPTI